MDCIFSVSPIQAGSVLGWRSKIRLSNFSRIMADLTLNTQITLNNGRHIPAVGLGVYRAQPGESTQSAVLEALKVRFRWSSRRKCTHTNNLINRLGTVTSTQLISIKMKQTSALLLLKGEIK